MKTPSSNQPKEPAGLSGDPAAFMALTEIAIIAHLADTLFARILPDGLSTAQFGVLNHLLRLKRQETIGELAHAMQVSQPTMSSTVRKLEDKGFISLVPDPSDRRIKRVSVTQAGETARQDAVARILPLGAEVLAPIPETTWQELLPLLTQIRDALDRERSPKSTSQTSRTALP